jgi:hypothetical protein
MIANPSFESGPFLADGSASSWTSTEAGAAEETAAFAGDSAYAAGAYETFDHGWGAIDPEVVINSLNGLTASAIADTMDEWALNESVMVLAATEAAITGGQAFEAFETGWGATIDTDFRFVSSELAAGVVDDFSSWGTTALTLGSTTTNLFSIDLTAEQFTTRVRQRVEVNVTANQLEADTAFVGSAGDTVTLKAEGGQLPDPLVESFTYVLQAVFDRVAKVARYADDPDSLVTLTTQGVGAIYVSADPTRFWLEEL